MQTYAEVTALEPLAAGVVSIHCDARRMAGGCAQMPSKTQHCWGQGAWGGVGGRGACHSRALRSMSECGHGRATSSCGTTPALAEMRRRRGGWAKGWRVRRRVGSSKYQLANRYLFSKSSPATLSARNTLLIAGACPDRCRSPAERGHYVRQF